jgi:predicted Rossmann fold flavoprotein
MCAAQAGKRGKRVLLLDHAAKVAGKIRISGGGRCNFTNLHTTPKNFLSQNPHFCVSALSRYTQHDFIALVKKHGIAYHEKTRGQLFCDGSSRQIIDMMLKECADAHVEIRTGAHVDTIARSEAGYHLQTNTGALTGTSLVIATGGPSIPKMGSSGFGYDVAKQFGLPVIAPRAGLVPITFTGPMLAYVQSLAGVAVDAVVSCNKTSFTEAILFTHRGMSGPAMLQISSYWNDGDTITIDLAPNQNAWDYLKEEKQRNNRQELHTLLARLLPKRLAARLSEDQRATQKLAELPDRQLKTLAEAIHQWRIIPDGTEGYRTAEVTVGGIDTNALSSKTFEAKAVPGLYFIGEVVDVTGHLGGFNFQWAWSSGHAAGQFV